MACLPFTLTVDAARWAELKAAALARAGVSVNRDAGVYNGHGFRVQWDYAEPRLTIEIVEHPAFLACGFLVSQITHAAATL